jgi:predicted Zn-ribbon and HTH transcriptional regulator
MTVLAALERACKRCGHTWLKRKAEDPKNCPKCKSPYWDRERTRPKNTP